MGRAALGLMLVLISLILPPGLPLAHRAGSAAWAGPVDWHEVPASQGVRQWWDAGSLRRDRRGTLSVLSRFQPVEAETPPAAQASDPGSGTGPDGEGSGRVGRQPLGTLVVMELDCDLGLYRDVAVNGLPRFNATWQPTGGDPLVTATLQEACAAALAAGLVPRGPAG